MRLLAATTAEELRAQPFSYAEIGQTAHDLPVGYATLNQTTTLAATDFEAAVAALLSWRVQQRAGIEVTASSARVEAGAVALLRLGLGPFGIDAPVRIVYVVDGLDRQGFAYGALPGHPESGEESFELVRDAAGRITFTVRAFSRPASVLARLGGPLARAVQRSVTGRYLRALDR
jgi:uncharacterized protein (UPF0548 family)